MSSNKRSSKKAISKLFSSIRTGMLTQREPRRLIFNNYENNSFNEEDNDSQNKDDSENPSTRKSQIELKSSASTPNLQFLSGSKPSTAPDFKLGVNLKFDKRSSMQIMAPAIKLEPEVKVSQFKSKVDDKTVLKSKFNKNVGKLVRKGSVKKVIFNKSIESDSRSLFGSSDMSKVQSSENKAKDSKHKPKGPLKLEKIDKKKELFAKKGTIGDIGRLDIAKKTIQRPSFKEGDKTKEELNKDFYNINLDIKKEVVFTEDVVVEQLK